MTAGETDLAAVGALLAEPARAKVLLALGDGRSLAASPLAAEAGVAASTASRHLARLVDASLIAVETRGRHRHFSLAGPQVAELIEAVARVAPTQPVTSLREGTRSHALRYARRCYDHLAGRLGVAVSEGLCGRGALRQESDPARYVVTARGARMLAQLEIPAEAGTVARCCLDWTEQRNHVAGRLGEALLSRLLDLGWLRRDARTRALHFTARGCEDLPHRLGLQLP